MQGFVGPLAVTGLCVTVLFSPVEAQTSFGASPDSAVVDTLYFHDPYDLSAAAPVDSSDVYSSPGRSILSFPQVLWDVLVYPIGEFTIYAEHGKLLQQYYSWFTNADGTIGVFPSVALGGETGTGGGLRAFHTNLWNKEKILTGQYIYSGGRGQTGLAAYIDPDLFGSGLHGIIDVDFLRTRHDDSSINAAIEEDDTRVFRLDSIDLTSSLRWRRNRGPMFPYKPNTQAELWVGYSRRDFRAFRGGTGLLTDQGSTPEARRLRGIGSNYTLYRVGGRLTHDDRDYKRPRDSVILPLNYKLPGRIAIEHEGLYYFWRDLGYPESGGTIQGELELNHGSDDFRFVRMGAELQRFFTLFWQNRILAVRARLDKVSSLGNHFVPYTELRRLGGGNSARGYQRGFFTGEGAVIINVEYRWPIWDTWNAYLFWDEGQVFDRFGDISRAGFTTSVGGGIAIRTEIGLIAKVQVGHSADSAARVSFVVGGGF